MKQYRLNRIRAMLKGEALEEYEEIINFYKYYSKRFDSAYKKTLKIPRLGSTVSYELPKDKL